MKFKFPVLAGVAVAAAFGLSNMLDGPDLPSGHDPEAERDFVNDVHELPSTEAGRLRMQAGCKQDANNCFVGSEFAKCDVTDENNPVILSNSPGIEGEWVAGGSRGDVTLNEDHVTCNWDTGNGQSITVPAVAKYEFKP